MRTFLISWVCTQPFRVIYHRCINGPQTQRPPYPALPDGERKRRFILDCTGWQVWTAGWVRRPGGEIRNAAACSASVQKMIDMFGQGTGFPIISSWPIPMPLDPGRTESTPPK